MRALRCAVLVAGVWTGAATARDDAVSRSGCETTRTDDALQEVTTEGDVKLASGRLVKLSGLRLPSEPELRAAAASWLDGYRGRALEVLAGVEDRWGRAPARLLVKGPDQPFDMSHGLVEHGLALVDAGEAGVLCRVELLALEATARERGLGLWAKERYHPVAATDLARLSALTGSFALVEGRVRSVGERRRRTYLNFGADWSTDLTVTMSKRPWDRLQGRGVTAQSLRGRRIRARGVIEDWRGPAVEVTAAEMVEILDEPRARRREP